MPNQMPQFFDNPTNSWQRRLNTVANRANNQGRDRQGDRFATEHNLAREYYGTDPLTRDAGQTSQWWMKQIQPYMDMYMKAMSDYGQAGGEYMGGVRQMMNNLQNTMSGAGADYSTQMKQVLDRMRAAGAESRGAAAQGYGAGQSSLLSGQNQINQQMAANMARSGMGSSGMGAARSALGSAAGAYAAPGLSADYAQRLAEIAQGQAGMMGGAQGDMARTLYGMRGDTAGAIANMGTNMYGQNLDFRGNQLGAAGGLMNTQLGQFGQGAGMGMENLYALMGFQPGMWNMLHQQEMWEQQKKDRKWDRIGGLATGGIGSVLKALGNRGTSTKAKDIGGE